MRVVGVSSPTHPTQLLKKKKNSLRNVIAFYFLDFGTKKVLPFNKKEEEVFFEFLIHENNYIENTYVYFSFNNDREKKNAE